MILDIDDRPLPFAFVLSVAQLGTEATPVRWRANADERSALASYLDVASIDRLDFIGQVKRLGHGQALRLQASVQADITQICIVSLEPVQAHIDESFALVYMPTTSDCESQSPKEVLVEPDEEDGPELLVDDRIDLAAVVVEQVAMALDPYPRLDDAEMPEALVAKMNGGGKVSPFAVLEGLKEKG